MLSIAFFEVWGPSAVGGGALPVVPVESVRGNGVLISSEHHHQFKSSHKMWSVTYEHARGPWKWRDTVESALRSNLGEVGMQR